MLGNIITNFMNNGLFYWSFRSLWFCFTWFIIKKNLNQLRSEDLYYTGFHYTNIIYGNVFYWIKLTKRMTLYLTRLNIDTINMACHKVVYWSQYCFNYISNDITEVTNYKCILFADDISIIVTSNKNNNKTSDHKN